MLVLLTKLILGFKNFYLPFEFNQKNFYENEGEHNLVQARERERERKREKERERERERERKKVHFVYWYLGSRRGK